MNFKTYEDKIFLVEDNETRLRKADNLSQFDTYATSDALPDGCHIGDFKVIPKRTEVKISAILTDSNRTVFALISTADPDSQWPSGWTKASNLLGGLINEVVGLTPNDWIVPPSGNNYTVTDDQAFIRTGSPDFQSTGQTVEKGCFVLTSEISGDNKYARIFRGSVANGIARREIEIGWTSASNLTEGWTDLFTSPEWAETKGPNSCWEHGKFIGNKILVNIVGTGGEMEQVTLAGLIAYQKLVTAAAQKNLTISINSGFRTYARQEELYRLYRSGQGNTAAEPGKSNHQHGQAFDLNTHGFDGDPIYDWLKVNGPKFGFVRAVNKEHWHWEYRPAEAEELVARGEFKLPNVKI